MTDTLYLCVIALWDGKHKNNHFIYFVWVERWSLTLREQQRLRLFESRALRKAFGRKREDVRIGDSRLPSRGK